MTLDDLKAAGAKRISVGAGTGAVGSGFIRARLGPDHGACYGALPAALDIRPILRRQIEV